MLLLRNKKIIFELSSLPPLIWSSGGVFPFLLANILLFFFISVILKMAYAEIGCVATVTLESGQIILTLYNCVNIIQ